MFARREVELLVECAARALQSEEEYLQGCFRQRGWRHPRAGIRANTNERYYQFLIWRELIASFPLRAETERDTFDLAFFDNDSGRLAGLCEIKGWWSSKGEKELPGILRDVRDKLQKANVPGAMLILTEHAADSAEQNFRTLAGCLGCRAEELVTRSFPTTKNLEFAVISLLV